MRHAVILLAAALSLGACASFPERIDETRSGRPEATFLLPQSEVLGQIANSCLDRRMTIERGATHVVCARPVSSTIEILSASLNGVSNSYSTTPEIVERYDAVPDSGKTRVVVTQMMRAESAFGQNRESLINDVVSFNDMTYILWALGGRPAPD